jgi:integrase
MARASITRRETKNGPRFVVRFRLGGRYTSVQHGGSFATLKDARTRRDMVAGELAAGRDPRVTLSALSAAPPPVVTLRQVAERWKASRIDAADETLANYASHFGRILPALGDHDPAAITVADVQEWVAATAAELKPSSVSRYVATLRQLLDFAGVSPNPARDARVKLPRIVTAVVEPPSGEQVDAILAHSPKRWRLPLRVLEQSGLRVGELSELEWRDVDVAGSRLRIRNGKTRAARRFASVPEWLMELIDSTCPPDDRVPERRVFAGFSKHVARNVMLRACKAAGIPHYHPHDLRHRYASVKLAEGVPLTNLAEQLGHTKKSLTLDTYSHVLLSD